MPNEGKMNIDERRKCLRRMKKRYVQADRKEQGRLLDEMKPTSSCQPTVPESHVRGVVGVRVFADAPLPMVDVMLLDFHLHQFDLTDYLVVVFGLFQTVGRFSVQKTQFPDAVFPAISQPSLPKVVRRFTTSG